MGRSQSWSYSYFMFVCVCKGIRRSDLESLAHSGRGAQEDIKQLTGAGTECGTCELRVQRVLKEIQSQAQDPNLTEAEDVAG